MIKISVFNIDTLAEKAGVSRRTIHYYLQRGLLMPPEGDGRGSHYTETHLLRLKELQQLSRQGVPLLKIKEYFDRKGNHTAFLEPVSIENTESRLRAETWNRYELFDGIELHLRGDVIHAGKVKGIIERVREEVLKRIPPSNEETK